MVRRILTVVATAWLSVPVLFGGAAPAMRTNAALDQAVTEWRTNPASPMVRVMLTTADGAKSAVKRRLERLVGVTVTESSSPNLLVARVSPAGLDAAVRDGQVLNISMDAPVHGLQLNLSKTVASTLQSVSNPVDLTASVVATQQSHLLNTLGLTSSQGGSWVLNPNTGAGIGVAVVDSGLDQNYTSLDSVDYFDATSGAVRHVNGRADLYGHGTHVAGLLGSNGLSSNGQYRGVAPRVKLVVFKVLDGTGTGASSDVINAINYVVANRAALGVKVISMSLGHPIYEPASRDPLVAAVQNAAAQGVVVVVAAGNFGGDPKTHVTGYGGITSPGNAPNAITVGAVETLQTDSRSDDSVAWFSSRGPTWFDAYQKPDVVAPGSHLVSNISTASTIYHDYPNGVVKSGLMPFFRMSGTSMSTPIVAGVVADMLQAAQLNGVTLTPNAVKAILQYTAIPVGTLDTLTQGTGQVNAAGAIALASAIKPNAKSGEWWLGTGIEPYSTIVGERVEWAQRFIWGDTVVDGDQVFTNDPAWGNRVVWGDRAVWGDRVVWGRSTVWDGNEQVWANSIIWGSSVLGTTDGTSIVWGNLLQLGISPTGVLQGNLERANGDLAAR
jgi:serine protease AprX